MSTKDLVNAIISGDALEIETSFNAAMSEKISVAIDDKRQEVAQSLFNQEAVEHTEQVDEEVELTEEEIDAQIQEVLSKDASAGEWISDFVKSDNPKFEGKSKEKRKQMALAAYYANKRGS